MFPIFALMLFGLIDLGRWVYTANSLNQVAREAARAGSVGFRPAECASQTRGQCIETIARTRTAAVAVNPGRATTGTTAGVIARCDRYPPGSTTPTAISPDSCRTNDLLVVEVRSTFSILTPLIGQFLGSQPISGQARVNVNQ